MKVSVAVPHREVCKAVIITDGVTGPMVMWIFVLVAVGETAQRALVVITTQTLSLLARPLSIYRGELVPTAIPFLYH